jgi:hypothetical protein
VTSRRPGPLLALVWVGGVVLATATGLLAVRLVADQVGDPAVPVLSSGDVAKALAATTPTPAPTRSAAPSPSPAVRSPAPDRSPAATSTRPAAARVRVFTSAGGSVGARCRGRTPERVYATPAQGYRLDESSIEGGVLEVRFESDRTRVRLEIACASSGPVLAEQRTEPRHGGD